MIEEIRVSSPPRPPPGRNAPGPALPLLGYADPAVNRQDRDRRRDGVADRLGGWRQVVFATGLAGVLGGFAYCLEPNRIEGPFVVFLGAILVGLTLPLTRRS
jgi:hypothetical protein